MEKNMNVTLSLTTELEDVPKELSYMLKYIEQELNLVSLNVSNLSKRANVTHDNDEAIIAYGNELLELLHGIRISMAKADTRMEDCMAVLSGYIHYTENPPEQAEDPEEEQNEEG